MMMVPRSNFDLFDDIFGDSFFRRENNKLMRTDIRKIENGYAIDVDLPGYGKEDIKIDVTSGYLTINAKMQQEENDNSRGNYVRRERFFGECSRSFYVGDEVEVDDIKAVFRNGILSLEIPKVEENKKLPEKRYIEIGD